MRETKQLVRRSVTGKIVKWRLETDDGKLTIKSARTWGLLTARTFLGYEKRAINLPDGAAPGIVKWILTREGDEAYVVVVTSSERPADFADCLRDSAAGVGIDAEVYLFAGIDMARFELTYPKVMEWRVATVNAPGKRRGASPDIGPVLDLRATVLRQIVAAGLGPDQLPAPYKCI